MKSWFPKRSYEFQHETYEILMKPKIYKAAKDLHTARLPVLIITSKLFRRAENIISWAAVFILEST